MKYTYPDNSDNFTISAFANKEPFPTYSQKSESFFLEKVKSTLGTKKNTMLDLGSGEGRLADYFIDYFNKIVLLEPDKSRMLVAKRRLSKYHQNKRNIFEYINQSFLNANFGKRKFDVILCSHVIQHVPSTHVEKILKKISNLLTDNGLLVLSTCINNNDSDNDIYLAVDKMMNNKNLALSSRQFNNLYFDNKHYFLIHFFGINNLLLAFKRFSVVKVWYYHAFYKKNLFDAFIFRDTLLNFFKVGKSVAEDVFIIASKKIC